MYPNTYKLHGWQWALCDIKLVVLKCQLAGGVLTSKLTGGTVPAARLQ